MNPIDQEVGKGDEEGNLDVIVQGKRGVRGGIVEFCVAAHFPDEEWGGEDGHNGHGDEGLADFQGDLVFKVFGVGEGGMVEDEDVGERGANEVDHRTEEPEHNQSIYGGESRYSSRCIPCY